ncbi:M3 family oligoendopeptidase [Thermus filiformis]|uniref:Oligoendopeptidase F n=1 Tax=Thermus filiformis TaxID=276 RepID=A0A0A2WNC1_THEFI|nr:M3 family oligoendopeptidase [Thermus filiformis]KGQ21323.2 oligoendopeptidase F [Thermus filiformis]
MEWDLSDLYASPKDPRILKDLEEALALSQEAVEGLRPEAEVLAQKIALYEKALEKGYKPLLYASLYFSTHTQDAEAKALLDQARSRFAELKNRLLPLELYLKTLPEEDFRPLLEAPGLSDLRHWLGQLRAFAPYTLSEKEERILNLKSLVGRSAWSQFYTEYTGRFRFLVDGKSLTDAEVRALRRSPDPRVRREAHRALYGKLLEEAPTLSYIFNAVFQDFLQDLSLRGYDHPLRPTALSDELEVEDILRLLEATEARYGLVEAYYRLKARRLGLEKTPSPDLLAPFGEEPRVEFKEAQALVLEAFGRFSPEMAEIAREFFQKRWIDVYPRPGKRGGAFCSGGLPSTHPYVLLNHTDDLDSAHTLAHELGHGVHFYLARRQRLLNFGATTPLAETASVFAEILLDDLLMERLSTREERATLLANRLEDAIATAFRQVMYTRFELRAVEARKEGALAPEAFHALWDEEQRRLYGDGVEWTELDKSAWSGIPHFVHYRFYTYSYAYGYLLVLALYARYLEEGRAFVPKYLEILAAGESESPEAILRKAGLNPKDPGFWEGSFRVLEGWLKELEGLL